MMLFALKALIPLVLMAGGSDACRGVYNPTTSSNCCDATYTSGGGCTPGTNYCTYGTPHAVPGSYSCSCVCKFGGNGGYYAGSTSTSSSISTRPNYSSSSSTVISTRPSYSSSSGGNYGSTTVTTFDGSSIALVRCVGPTGQWFSACYSGTEAVKCCVDGKQCSGAYYTHTVLGEQHLYSSCNCYGWEQGTRCNRDGTMRKNSAGNYRFFLNTRRRLRGGEVVEIPAGTNATTGVDASLLFMEGNNMTDAFFKEQFEIDESL